MQAAFITTYGPLENIRVGAQPKPGWAKGEVLVRMKAASVNPIDYKQALIGFYYAICGITPSMKLKQAA